MRITRRELVAGAAATGIAFATNDLFAKPSQPALEIGVLTFSFHEITEGGMPAVDQMFAMSPWYRINLDVAHFSSAGYDPVAFIAENHRNIVSLHLHDRKKNSGPSVPNGEGDTPLREILLLLRSKRLKIPLFYELEWVGSGQPLPEIERDLRYIRGLAI